MTTIEWPFCYFPYKKSITVTTPLIRAASIKALPEQFIEDTQRNDCINHTSNRLHARPQPSACETSYDSAPGPTYAVAIDMQQLTLSSGKGSALSCTILRVTPSSDMAHYGVGLWEVEIRLLDAV